MNHYSTCFLRVKTELTESSNRPNRFWDNTRIFLLLMQTKYSNRRLYFKLLTQQSRKRHDILQSNDMETEVEKNLSHSVNHTSDSYDVCREDGATSEAVTNYQIPKKIIEIAPPLLNSLGISNDTLNSLSTTRQKSPLVQNMTDIHTEPYVFSHTDFR